MAEKLVGIEGHSQSWDRRLSTQYEIELIDRKWNKNATFCSRTLLK